MAKKQKADKTSVDDSGKYTGVVKWFNLNKGFGFIIKDLDGGEVFVHFTSIEGADKLKEGDRVEFYIEVRPKGESATSVTLLKP